MTDKRQEIEDWFKGLQDSICQQVEKLDGTQSFHQDLWSRPEGGGGRSRILENGALIAKGGVNFSAVFGAMPENISSALKLAQSEFYATGVSIVLHPVNPWVPIIHMNVRYFETSPREPGDSPTYWFGGGIDLTPHYVRPEDGGYIHQQLKNVCDKTDPNFYHKFKSWADDYFFIKHRNETRGVGGIFYDRLNEGSTKHSFEELWDFQQNVGNAFASIYSHYAQKYKDRAYGEEHLAWQRLRRGRYAEFNLVWDKGTRFGLDTNGRTESILMSMPPEASWKYNHQPDEDTPEYKTLQWLRKGIDWLQHA